METNLDTILSWEKLDLSGIKVSTTLNSIIFSFDNNDYEYKVAVAKCGPQDPALYYHHWGERYSNVIETKDSTKKVNFSSAFESNNKIVNNLKGRLLLIQGDMDLHVPP